MNFVVDHVADVPTYILCMYKNVSDIQTVNVSTQYSKTKTETKESPTLASVNYTTLVKSRAPRNVHWLTKPEFLCSFGSKTKLIFINRGHLSPQFTWSTSTFLIKKNIFAFVELPKLTQTFRY